MISFAHYRDMQVLEAVYDFHNSCVDKDFGVGQKFINQRDKFDALTNLRDLAVNGFTVSEGVTDSEQNFFQNGIAVAEASIIRVTGMKSAENQNINFNVGQKSRADKLSRKRRVIARVQNIFPAKIYQRHHCAGNMPRLIETYFETRKRDSLQKGDGRNISFYLSETFFQLRD